MKNKNEIWLIAAFVIMVVGWVADISSLIPTWIAWCLLILSVGMAVGYKISNNKDKKREESIEEENESETL